MATIRHRANREQDENETTKKRTAHPEAGEIHRLDPMVDAGNPTHRG